jgi:hypothetical protein
MTPEIVLAARCTRSFAGKLTLSHQRAQGRPGARPTRGLMCDMGSKCCMSIQIWQRHPAFPAQWLYGLYEIVLVTGFLATIIPEKRLLLDELTPAPGRRTQTISLYASAALVSRSSSVHRIPPHGRDDRDRPSCRGRRADLNA